MKFYFSWVSFRFLAIESILRPQIDRFGTGIFIELLYNQREVLQVSKGCQDVVIPVARRQIVLGTDTAISGVLSVIHRQLSDALDIITKIIGPKVEFDVAGPKGSRSIIHRFRGESCPNPGTICLSRSLTNLKVPRNRFQRIWCRPPVQ